MEFYLNYRLNRRWLPQMVSFVKWSACPNFSSMAGYFSIQSQSEKLQQYKLECYRILYEHFHGAIIGRKNLLSEKMKAQKEIDEVFNQMDTEAALKYQRAQKRVNHLNAELQTRPGTDAG